jgi:hypothetical protein
MPSQGPGPVLCAYLPLGRCNDIRIIRDAHFSYDRGDTHPQHSLYRSLFACKLQRRLRIPEQKGCDFFNIWRVPASARIIWFNRSRVYCYGLIPISHASTVVRMPGDVVWGRPRLPHRIIWGSLKGYCTTRTSIVLHLYHKFNVGFMTR